MIPGKHSDTTRVKVGSALCRADSGSQGVAWAAREFGLTATIAVPEHAPRAKLDAIERLAGRIVKLPYVEWGRRS